MTIDRWQRLQELFNGLIELAPELREQWLESVEADPELRREAVALIQADEDQQPGVTSSVHAAISETTQHRDLVNVRLGPYCLQREIGAGGMGTVFLAQRVDAEFDHRVAVKLIRGIATQGASQRLRRERQILADLNHPHIARLLDGGTTDSGQPYLVMDFIEGEAITVFCQRHKSTLAARLELIQKVARAVHYAHQRLVVHRDLKPANVLVREDGEPVLLDFGIAKLLDVNADTDSVHTGAGWFTRGYASPEQLRGEAVSTATDVYALGVLLYEIVSGSVPPASTLASLRLPIRGANGERFDRDLGAIVAKATHPDPERRYGSAEAFASDLGRHLSGQPVEATPDNLAYRLRKFACRYPLSVAALVVALLLAGLFTWRLMIERNRALSAEARASQESMNSERVVDYLVSLFDLASPENNGKEEIAPRELVDRGLAQLEGRLQTQPRQRARLISAIGEIYLRLGLTKRSVETSQLAVDIGRANGDQIELARYLGRLAAALNASEQRDQAAQVAREALALYDSAPSPSPDRVSVLTTLAAAEAQSADLNSAISHAEQAVTSAEVFGAASREHLAEALSQLSAIRLRRGELDAATDSAQRAVTIATEESGRDSVQTLLARHHLGDVLLTKADFEGAEQLLREVLEGQLKRYEENSLPIVATRALLAHSIDSQGRPFESIALLETNVQSLAALGEKGTQPYMMELNNLGGMHEKVGNYSASEVLYRQALNLAESAPPGSDNGRLLIYRQNLGRVLTLEGSYSEAQKLLEREVSDSEQPEAKVNRMRRWLFLSDLARRQRRYDAASNYLLQADAAFRAVLPSGHEGFGALARERSLLLQDLGQNAEAETALREAIQLQEVGRRHPSAALLGARIELADMLRNKGDLRGAYAIASIDAAEVRARFVSGAPVRVKLERVLNARKAVE
jgi:serine/threonine-protein kinase